MNDFLDLMTSYFLCGSQLLQSLMTQNCVNINFYSVSNGKLSIRHTVLSLVSLIGHLDHIFFCLARRLGTVI